MGEGEGYGFCAHSSNTSQEGQVFLRSVYWCLPHKIKENGEQHFILNSLIFTNRIVISSSKTQDSYGIFKQFVQNRIILNASRLIKFIA